MRSRLESSPTAHGSPRGFGRILLGLLLLGAAPGSTGAGVREIKPLPGSPGVLESTALPGSSGGPSLTRREVTVSFSGDAAAGQEAIKTGLARPVTLASADLDEDGVPDLIAGYAGVRTGFLSIHFGNPDAIYPFSPEARERRARGRFTDSPFLPEARVVSLPEAPDFLAARDFDGDDHVDLITCAREGAAMLFLAGNGKGEFAPASRIDLDGRASALATGEIGRPHGLPAVLVAVESPAGYRLSVFDSPQGAVRALPQSLPLPERGAALALGRLDDDDWIDLAVAAGGDVLMLRGRDLSLPAGGSLESSLAPLFPAAGSDASLLQSIALGDYDGDGALDLARLTTAGTLSVGPVPRLTTAGSLPGLPLTSDDGAPATAAPQLVLEGAGKALLVRAKLSGRPGDDLVLWDNVGGRLTVLAGPDRRTERPEAQAATTERHGLSLERWGGVEVAGRPAAALPMRLHPSAINDLVVLQEGSGLLTQVTPIIQAAFGVTNTANSGAGSLRQAILDANATSAADTISFNIPGGGPFIIQPLTPLPTLTFPVTIDGNTQPGFAGTPIIQIDGNVAGNGVHGLVVAGGASTIRGLVIGRFGGAGVGDGLHIQGAGNNIIENNYIGTDVTGAAARPNTGSGVVVDNVGGNTIGSTATAGRNVLSGNAASGVLITGASATGNMVEGNFIGTRAGGSAALGNGSRGVMVDGSPTNTIGISNVLPNIISGNGAEGVLINGAGATGTVMRGNYIGANATGMAGIRNTLAGVRIVASNATVGGTTVGQRNIIAFNGSNGVTVVGGSANRLMRNQTFSNSSLGIDLGDDGVTANDAGDADTGANGLQNAPVLTSAITDATSSTIMGTFNSRPSATFTVEFFSSPDCDPSGRGEGRQYFMSASLTTDAAGNAAINLSQPIPLPARTFLTTTASDSGASTSEFSNCIRVSDQTPAEITGETWNSATQLSWGAAAGATSYKLYRGQGPYLPNLVNSAQESCLRMTVATTTTGTTLTEAPAGGSVYWYMVAGVNNFGEGNVGDATIGPRVLDSFGNCPTCAHEKCVVGGPLTSGCDPCVASVCANTPSCCSTQWTSACVDRVLSVCGSLECSASAGACPHLQCVTGVALPTSCDSPPVSPSCVATVCGSDPVCCSATWDSTCVEEVGTACSKTCN